VTNQPLIAIDAMGGDEGVPVMVAGAALALERNLGLRFLLVGDETEIQAALQNHPELMNNSEILHTTEKVNGEDRPSQAIRKSRGSSMGLAIKAVKSGQVNAAVSAGNTGALMAMSKLALRTISDIDRPALAALLPTFGDHDVVMLDLGANTECDARNLVQFAVMGAAYARAINGFDKPSVKLLNIQGFTEADKINSGKVDVIVCDGYSGNIALKAVEGAARFVTDLLKRAFTSSLRSKFGFLVSRPATELLRHHLDPNNHNGAVFLGLNGVVVKSHGSANVKGMANAIEVACRLVEDNITSRISEDISSIEDMFSSEKNTSVENDKTGNDV